MTPFLLDENPSSFFNSLFIKYIQNYKENLTRLDEIKILPLQYALNINTTQPCVKLTEYSLNVFYRAPL